METKDVNVTKDEVVQQMLDCLIEWQDLADLPSGGYGGDLRERTHEAILNAKAVQIHEVAGG